MSVVEHRHHERCNGKNKSKCGRRRLAECVKVLANDKSQTNKTNRNRVIRNWPLVHHFNVFHRKYELLDPSYSQASDPLTCEFTGADTAELDAR
jgi:hypothetical protein